MAEEGPTSGGRWRAFATAVSSVVAPITLVTSLLVYSAWRRTTTFFQFFGVDSSLLGLSVQDYLLRSADTAFGLLVWISVGCVLLLITARLGNWLIQRFEHPWRKRMRAVGAGIALALVLLGLLAALWPMLSGALTPYGSAAILVGGALLLGRTRRGLGSAGGTVSEELARAVLVTVIAAACFWAATDYASDLATRAAEEVDVHPASLAEVDLYSKQPLDMPGSLVKSMDVPVTPSTKSYRYVGLRLLDYDNNRWLVIPGRREGLHCSVLILKDSDDIRVQIASPRG